jgi:hypothetical protein
MDPGAASQPPRPSPQAGQPGSAMRVERMINEEDASTAEVAPTGSGEHAAQQDQTHRLLAAAGTTTTTITTPSSSVPPAGGLVQQRQDTAATAATATAPPTPATPRQEVELTDAGTRLKLQGKLDEGLSRPLHVVLIVLGVRACVGLKRNAAHKRGVYMLGAGPRSPLTVPVLKLLQACPNTWRPSGPIRHTLRPTTTSPSSTPSSTAMKRCVPHACHCLPAAL